MESTEKSKRTGIEAYERKEYDTAIQTFLELIRGGQADAELYTTLGLAYKAKGRPNEAAEALNKSLSLNGNNFTAMLALGQVIARWGKPDDAIGALQRASQLNPKSPVPFAEIGHLYAIKSEVEQAIAQYQKARQLAPGDDTVLGRLGELYVLKGDLKGIDGDAVTIADRKAGEVTVPRDQIHTAHLVLTDALIAATRPIDTTGAEDILETEEE